MFNKSIQLAFVEEYFEKFKSLKAIMLCKNPHLTKSYFVLSFMSGLKEDIKNTIQMFKPTTFSKTSI